MADRKKFEGLELADSISLDPHKWLYQPLDCGCLLYRSFDSAQRTFAHSGEYARSLTADPIEGFVFFEESLELSRRFRALKLWLSLRYHGVAAFRESIAKDLAQARRLANAIKREPALELLAPVELSAVCFRYRGVDNRSNEELNSFNTGITQARRPTRASLSFECIAARPVQSSCLHREPSHERCRRRQRHPRSTGRRAGSSRLIPRYRCGDSRHRLSLARSTTLRN